MCESLAVSAGSQEKGAIGAMFEREMKQEKNLEVTFGSVERYAYVRVRVELSVDTAAKQKAKHSRYIIACALYFVYQRSTT